MLNNLEYIKPMLTFTSEDDFYYLQLIRRKKDNPDLGKNSSVIKNYYITSVEKLEEKMPEIIGLCDKFNARASLRLNRRSFRHIAFKTLQNIANTMSNGEYMHCRSSYDRACGTESNQKTDKRWIIDIDFEAGKDLVQETLDIKNEIVRLHQAIKGNIVHTTFRSASGFHIICNPFNVMEFKKTYPNIDIHKDNPTNLYLP